MHWIARLILALLLSTLTACTDANSCPDSAQQFWTKFRVAVLKDDFDTLAGMTHFPLEVRGDADNNPTKFIYRKNFNKHFSYLLNLDLGRNEYEPNPKPIPATMKEFARVVTRLPGCNEDGDYFRMGKMVFLLKPEGWRFIAFYSTDFISIKTEEPLHTTPIRK